MDSPGFIEFRFSNDNGKKQNISILHSVGLVNEFGNFPRPGPIPKFSDLEVIALSMTSEALFIDSEHLLFIKLKTDYKTDFPNIISRRQYNDRRKLCLFLKRNPRTKCLED